MMKHAHHDNDNSDDNQKNSNQLELVFLYHLHVHAQIPNDCRQIGEIDERQTQLKWTEKIQP